MTHSEAIIPRGEEIFILLVAALMAITAMSTDIMLPALPSIAADLGASAGNQQQFVILIFFIGLGLGQIVLGPLSDSIGRKPVIMIGLSLFMAGSIVSIFAQDYTMMLVGRLIQGLGVSAPRAVTLAMVRDRFEGDVMARLMSIVLVIYVIVPALAPALGQGILLFTNWQGIFWLFVILSLTCSTWLYFGQKETLAKDKRSPFTLKIILYNLSALFRSRRALGYTLAFSFVFTAFVMYLSTAQQMFQGIYRLGQMFPAVFALLALTIGFASLVNSRLVMQHGAVKVVDLSLSVLFVVSGMLLIWTILIGEPLHLSALIGGLSICFFCLGLVIGNLNALAMEPMGAAAGAASAVIGSMTTIISTTLATLFAQAYNDTLLPLLLSFITMSFCALLAARWASKA